MKKLIIASLLLLPAISFAQYSDGFQDHVWVRNGYVIGVDARFKIETNDAGEHVMFTGLAMGDEVGYDTDNPFSCLYVTPNSLRCNPKDTIHNAVMQLTYNKADNTITAEEQERLSTEYKTYHTYKLYYDAAQMPPAGPLTGTWSAERPETCDPADKYLNEVRFAEAELRMPYLENLPIDFFSADFVNSYRDGNPGRTAFVIKKFHDGNFYLHHIQSIEDIDGNSEDGLSFQLQDKNHMPLTSETDINKLVYFHPVNESGANVYAADVCNYVKKSQQ